MRRPLAGLLLALASAAALLLLACANAMAAAPAWGLESAVEPVPVPITAPVNQVETVTVAGVSGKRPNVGRFSLIFSNDLTGASAETKLLPYTASAAEVQEQLELLKIIGPGNVKVTGGPVQGGTETKWTYTITFVNGLGGYELEASIEAGEEAEATAKEEKELPAGEAPEEGEVFETGEVTTGGRDTVEYTLTPLNTGTTATSGTITVTDTLPANLTTKKTPESSGWTCTPAGAGNRTITCTSITAVPAGAKASTLWIEAYVDTASAKPGELLVNHATISGGGPSSAEAVDNDLISNTTPAVMTGAASGLKPNSASLSGTVNPEGKTVTSCFFEYGTSTAYGSTAPCATSPGSGTAAVAVSAAVASLKARTAYHFRIVANGSAGAQINSYGEDESFTTTSAPVAVTGGASAVTQTSATLSATVNPNGLQVTNCTLEYGPTGAYGASVPCSPQPGSGEGVVPVSAQVGGLSPGTVYHFRVRAESASAGGEGEDQSFQTLTSTPVSMTVEPTATVPPAATTSVPAIPDAELSGAVLTASPSGLIAAKVTCPAAESGGCAGTITLRTITAVRVGKAKAAVLTLATGAFRLAGGRSATVVLHLSSKGRTVLARSHTLRVLATVAARDSAGASHTAQRTVTVRLAKAARSKH